LLSLEGVRQQRAWEKEEGESGGSQDGEEANTSSLPTSEELSQIVLELFMSADKERVGYLTPTQFMTLMDPLCERLPLTESDVRMLMAEADENHDGVIEYEEFVPLAVDLIEAMYAKAAADEEMAVENAEAVETAEDMLLNGMSREQLEETLKGVFEKADTDGNGVLDRQEFRACLRQANIGLRKKDITALLAATDPNEEGKITYEQFVPVCFGVLVQRVARDVQHDAESQEQVAVEQYLLVELEKAASDAGSGDGLSFDLVRDVVKNSFPNLSSIMVHTVMSEAVEDEDGAVAYKDFVSPASAVLLSLEGVRQQRAWEKEEGESGGSQDGEEANTSSLPTFEA